MLSQGGSCLPVKSTQRTVSQGWRPVTPVSPPVQPQPLFQERATNQQWGIIAPLGFGALIVFQFLLFGRFCDFFLNTAHLPLVFSILGLVAAVLSGGFFIILKSRITITLLLYSAWLVAAIPFSVWKGGSYTVVVDEWTRSICAFLMTAGLIFTLDQSMKVMRTISYAMVVAALLALKYGIKVEGRLMHPDGMYANPNELASAMMLGCIYTWFVISNPGHSLFRRLWGWVAIIPLAFVMMQTGSRACLVALTVVFLFLLKYYTMAQRVLLLLLVAVGIGSVILMLPVDIRNRYFIFFTTDFDKVVNEQDLSQRAMAVGSSHQRLNLLLTSLRFTIEHPLFGVGPGQFPVAESSYALSVGRPGGAWKGTHNTYTEISSENGIPALLLYLMCMFFSYRELVMVEKLCRGSTQTRRIKEITVTAFTLKMVLLAYVVFYMFEHIAYSAFFPVLAGLILAFGRAARFEVIPVAETAAVGSTTVG